jgi:hypothetical protein
MKALTFPVRALFRAKNSNPADDPTVNMFWDGPRLPPLAWACMRSFIERGHRLRVFTYGELAIPAGAILADARDVIAHKPEPDERLSIAAFSDLFRYHLLYKYGGWWVDTDVYCLTPDLPPEPYAWAEQEPGTVNGAILRFPKGDALCGKLLKIAMRRSRKRHSWGAIGPDLLTKYAAGRSDLARSGSTAAFYPWTWLEAFLIWFPQTKAEVERRTKAAQFIHFWDHSLRQMGMDAYRDPPAHSYWADLIGESPNRVAADADYHRRTLNSIREFGQRYWKPELWEAYLRRHPDLFAAASV